MITLSQEGIALSGGQRARIGLARAIYRKPELILLDDPLSAVDRHVSKLIWETCIKKLLSDSAVLITTHQLNYINTSDYIYHIEDGKIKEHGKPEDILNENFDIGRRYHRFIATTNKKEEKEKGGIFDNIYFLYLFIITNYLFVFIFLITKKNQDKIHSNKGGN